MTVTAANVHDITQAAALIREDDEVVYGDSGYLGIQKRPEVAAMITYPALITALTAVPESCRMYLTTQLTGNDILKTASHRCAVRWSTHFGSSSVSSAIGKRCTADWRKTKTVCMPCSPVPIYMPLPSQGKNFPQPDIGVVCPFWGTGAEKQRINAYFVLKFP